MSSQRQLAATVAICTANRSARLAETLATVMPLAAAAAAELLVVDNGSTDDTPAVLERSAGEAAISGVRFRRVAEPRIGLSAARNRAVRESSGDLLLFLDDDALPGPGWIESYLGLFRDESVDAAGGPIAPIWSAALPGWLEERFRPYLSAWDRGPEPHELRYNEYPRGANLAIRRSSFGRFGDFLEQLGRKGASLRSCEEIEFCLRLERAGRRIVYLPAAGVRHHVAVERLTLDWMARRFAAQGFSEAILEWRHAGFAGLARGLARSRRVAAETARASSAATTEPFALCQKAALGGYRRGALYAMVATPRYSPPDGSAPAPFVTFS